MHPFRLVAELTRCGAEGAEARWRPTGGELGTVPRPRPQHVPSSLVLEALVECAGLLLQHIDGTPSMYWLLSGVDAADFAPTAWDHEIGLTCALLRRSSRAATLTVEATHDGHAVCHAQILMVRVPAV